MKRLTTEEFIKRVKSVHGDKYDYSKTVYKKSTERCVLFVQNFEKYFGTYENEVHNIEELKKLLTKIPIL